MIEELWLDIPKFEGRYAISSEGRLRRNSKNLIRRPFIDTSGYACIGLKINGIKKNYKIHRLVMETFKPIPNSSEMQVNHIDWDIINNSLSNLEWCTPSANLLEKQIYYTRTKSFKTLSYLLKIYSDQELDIILNNLLKKEGNRILSAPFLLITD